MPRVAAAKNSDEKPSKPVYLFSGEDSFRAYEKVKLWQAQFESKYGDLNSQLFYGENLSVSELQGALESYPFLSEKKLIIIYDFLAEAKDDDLKRTVELLDHVGDHMVLVFYEHKVPDARKALYKKIQKIGKVEDFKFLIGPQLLKWVQDRALKNGAIMGTSEASLLCELVGSDLWQVDNEIKKLALFADGKPINKEMIDEVVTVNLSSNIFKLTDALGDKKINEVLRIMQILIDNDEALIGILFALVSHFRTMVQVKYLLERGRTAAVIAKEIKKHPFVVNKTASQCRRFNDAELRQIYEGLAQIDADIKMGKIRISTQDVTELQRAMEVAFVGLCV